MALLVLGVLAGAFIAFGAVFMTVVMTGWQGDRPSVLSGPTAAITSTTKWYGLGMTLPVAKNADGSAITGTVQDEFIAKGQALGHQAAEALAVACGGRLMVVGNHQ